MVQDFLHTDQIAYSSEGELPGGLIMPAGQICYEKEIILRNAIQPSESKCPR